VRALDGVSFELAAGAIGAVVGLGGSGKTTLLRVLAGATAPTRGGAQMAGADLLLDPLRARAAVGYLPEVTPVYRELRVREFLRYRAGLKGLAGRRRRARLDAVEERCGLGELRGALLGRLSAGEARRVLLADALVHEPPVLLLDEPTTGLDPVNARRVREVLAAVRGEQTLLFSSHDEAEVAALSDRVFVLAAGRLAASGPWAELAAGGGGLAAVLERRAPA
jgi:ABC-2 type transport system ATP-binding protein